MLFSGPSGNYFFFADHTFNRFASSEKIKNCENLKKSGYACEKFQQVIQNDLNGSFHCKYTIDGEGEMIGHGQSSNLRSIACCFPNLLQYHGAASRLRRSIGFLYHRKFIMSGYK